MDATYMKKESLKKLSLLFSGQQNLEIHKLKSIWVIYMMRVKELNKTKNLQRIGTNVQ